MRKFVSSLVFVSLLMPQFAPAAFAYSDDAESASGRVRVFFAQAIGALKTAVTQPVIPLRELLSALLKRAAENPAFTALQRSGGMEAGGTLAELSEADASATMRFFAEALLGSMSSLAAHESLTASEVAQVSSELTASNFMESVDAAKTVLTLGVPNIIRGFTKNVFDLAAIAIPLMESGRALTFAAPETPRNFIIRAAATPAYAVGPALASWEDFQRNAADFSAKFSRIKSELRNSFNIPTTVAAVPNIARLMNRHIVNLESALNSAVRAGSAQDGQAAAGALDGAGGIIGDMLVLGRTVTVDGKSQFLLALTEFGGINIYDTLLELFPRVQYYANIARLLPSAVKPAGAERNIVSDPRQIIRRAEELGILETDKEIGQLRPRLEAENRKISPEETRLNALLKKNPDDENAAQQLAKLTAERDKLSGLVDSLGMIQRGAIFAYNDVKRPALSCNDVDECAMIRKIKEFSVKEVKRLLKEFTDKFIQSAEDAARSYYEGKVPPAAVNTSIENFTRGARSVFQEGEDVSRYGNGLYAPKPGRLRFDPNNPRSIAEGIFGYAFGGVYIDSDGPYPPSARVRQTMMVGLYMMEDALEAFAADCAKTPSAMMNEVMDKLAQYAADTSVLSEEGADEALKGILEKELTKYRGGLAQLLADFDGQYQGGLRLIANSIATLNGSWTAVYPDVTELLKAIPPALKALRELSDSWKLGLNVPAWVESARTAAGNEIAKIGGGVPPASLPNECPGEPEPPKKGCVDQAPVPTPSSGSGGCPAGYPTPASPNVPIRFGDCWASYCSAGTQYANYVYNGNPDVGRFVYICGNLPRENACLDSPVMTGICPTRPLPFEQYSSSGPASPEQCLTEAALKDVKESLDKCLSGDANAKASLAELWDTVKKYVKALALENLQKQMDDFPVIIESIIKSFVSGQLNDELMDLIEKDKKGGGDLISGSPEESIRNRIQFFGDAINQVNKMKFTWKDFSRSSGPKILDYSSRNDVAKKVFDAIYEKLGAIRYGANINIGGIPTRFDVANPIIQRKATAIGAALAALTFDVAKELNENWGEEGQLLNNVLYKAIQRLEVSAGRGEIFTGTGSVAARFFQSDIRKLLDPDQSSIPYVKDLYKTARAIDAIVAELQDLSKKNIEFQTAITACGNTYDVGDEIVNLAGALSDALGEAEKGTLARELAEGTGNMQDSGDAFLNSVNKKLPPKTSLERALAKIARAALQRFIDELAAQLKQNIR